MRDLAFTTSIRFQTLTNNPSHQIHYNPGASIEAQLSGLPKNSELNTLFFTGGHGLFAGRPLRFNELSPHSIDQIIETVSNKNGKVETIVADCCDGAAFIPKFKELLDDKKGVMLANVSDGRAHNVGELFQQYPNLRNHTIGMAMYDIISYAALCMDDTLRAAGIAITYPAIYVKKDNTLYYHGDEDLNIIEYLKHKNINVKKIDDLNKYMHKLLVIQTPVERHEKQFSVDSPIWQEYAHLINRIAANENVDALKLNDDALVQKLLTYLKFFFPDKSKLKTEDYTRRLLSLTTHLAKAGSNPIHLLARAACQYRLEGQQEKDIQVFEQAIMLELNINVAKRLVWDALAKEMEKENFDKDSPQLKRRLIRHANLVFSKSHRGTSTQIVDEVLALLNEKPSKPVIPDTPDTPVTPDTPIIKPKPINPNTIAKPARASNIWQARMLINPVLMAVLTFALLKWTPALSFFAIGTAATLLPLLPVVMGLFSLGLEYFIHKKKCDGLNKYYQTNDIQLENSKQDKLKAFLDGASNTYTNQFKSHFRSRDWQYAQDYYAGAKAAEDKQSELIMRVKAKVR